MSSLSGSYTNSKSLSGINLVSSDISNLYLQTSNVGNITTDVANLKVSNISTITNLNNLINANLTVFGLVSDLSNANVQSNVSILALQNGNLTNVNNITALINGNIQSNIRLTALQNANSQSNVAITALQNANSQSNVAITALQNANSQSNVAITALQNANSQSNVAITALQNGNVASNISITALQNANTNAFNLISGLTSGNTNAYSLISGLTSGNTNAYNLISGLTSGNTTIQARTANIISAGTTTTFNNFTSFTNDIITTQGNITIGSAYYLKTNNIYSKTAPLFLNGNVECKSNLSVDGNIFNTEFLQHTSGIIALQNANINIQAGNLSAHTRITTLESQTQLLASTNSSSTFSGNLQVKGNANITTSEQSALILNGNSNIRTSILFNTDAGGNITQYELGVRGTAGNPNNSFYIYNNTNGNTSVNAYRFLIDSTGNVGIGTTNSTASLEVYTSKSSGDPSSYGLYMYNAGTTNTCHAVINARSNTATGGNAYISLDVNGVGGWSIGNDNYDVNRLKIKPTWDFSGTNSYITINRTNGYVGINTNTPQNTLHVYGSVQGDYGFYCSNSQIPATQSGYMSWNYTGGSGETDFFNIQPSASFTEAFRWYNRVLSPTAQSLIMTLLKNGYLGLNTSPAYPLDINGQTTSSTYTNPSAGKYFSRTAAITSLGSTTTFNCSIHCTGSIWIDSSSGTSTDNSFVSGNSDLRIKKNIEVLDCKKALEKIRQITPVLYDYIDDIAEPNVYKKLGFIAQDVKKVMPECVCDSTVRFIPNIYTFAKWHDYVVYFKDKHGFDIGSKHKMQIIYENGEKEEKETLEMTVKCLYTLQVNKKSRSLKEVLVYGTQIDDFHTLARDNIYITLISAVKEIDIELKELKDKFEQIISGY